VFAMYTGSPVVRFRAQIVVCFDQVAIFFAAALSSKKNNHIKITQECSNDLEERSSFFCVKID
jgi:hypothetical protein